MWDFYGLLQTNMQTEQLRRYTYWRWQYVNRQLSCPVRSPTYNGNSILKYFSSEAVNFISLRARIGSIFPSLRGFKHKTHQKYWKNKKYIYFNGEHLFFPLDFCCKVCLLQSGWWISHSNIPGDSKDVREMQYCEIAKTPFKIELQSPLLSCCRVTLSCTLYKILLSVMEPTNYIQCYTVNMSENTGSECRFSKG